MANGASGDSSGVDLDVSRIREWRSIVTLLVFVFTNIVVLHPFYIPVYIPKCVRNWTLDVLAHLRIISPRRDHDESRKAVVRVAGVPLVRFDFPMNLVTAPLAADCFLLAILAIGRTEVEAGTLGDANIAPYDIMIFFVTLAYIAVSLDATGLIKYMSYRVLKWAGKHGRRLYFCLYLFFFGLTAFIGNDPIILSGTPFLAYMCRISKNIASPRAWIFTQFTMANVASAILVSSNPTNLVLAGAFQIRFIDYSANVIVPVIVTAILLFPFLLFVVFRDETLIPSSIDMHELPEGAHTRKPVNPNIPMSDTGNADAGKLLSLEEIMNPYLDKWSAIYVAVVMAVTLITVLALNAATAGSGGSGGHAYPVYWCTLPGAFITFCFDVAAGWARRHESREIARRGLSAGFNAGTSTGTSVSDEESARGSGESGSTGAASVVSDDERPVATGPSGSDPVGTRNTPPEGPRGNDQVDTATASPRGSDSPPPLQLEKPRPATLTSLVRQAWKWARETFPNASHVLELLPWPLVPFAFAMFVLVQALVTKGWVPVFAYGWEWWVNKTGTVGAIAGMGFLAVVLCNFAGTNIGTTILLSRVIQAWMAIHARSGAPPISDRTFWATVYSMAIGVNYGAFSFAFSGSLAGLLWKEILAKKHIAITTREFAWVNLPIIAFAMVVGCTVLVGEVYLIRGEQPYAIG